MSTNYRKAIENMEESLLQDDNLPASEIRKKLQEEGVDVQKFLTKFDDVFRKGVQQRAKEEAIVAKAKSDSNRGTIFGDLILKGREELLAFWEAAMEGKYGIHVKARCRNKNATSMTDEEIRSWLQDIEKLNGPNGD